MAKKKTGYPWYLEVGRSVNEAIAAAIAAHCGLDSSHDTIRCADGEHRKLWGLRTKKQVLLVHKKFEIEKDFNVFKRGLGGEVWPANHYIQSWHAPQKGVHTTPITT